VRLSDAEIVAVAQKRAFNFHEAIAQSDTADHRLGANHVVFQDFDEFLEKNPNCCRVVTEQDPIYRPEMEIENWPRYTGRFRAWFYTEVDAGNGSSLRRLQVIGNCGHVSSMYIDEWAKAAVQPAIAQPKTSSRTQLSISPQAA